MKITIHFMLLLYASFCVFSFCLLCAADFFFFCENSIRRYFNKLTINFMLLSAFFPSAYCVPQTFFFFLQKFDTSVL